jgi:hypothetical protein
VVFDCTGCNRYSVAVKPEPREARTVLNLRDMPKHLIAKVKAVAALEGASLRDYVTAILQEHVDELEKKGRLPKGKA